jgi:hypothetical protein
MAAETMSSLAGVMALSSFTARTGPSVDVAEDEQIRQIELVSNNRRKNELRDEQAWAGSAEGQDPILTLLARLAKPSALKRNERFIALFWRLLC